MIPHRRKEFNSSFTPERYRAFQQAMDEAVGMHIAFRLCETPVFITGAFERKLFEAARDILAILRSPEYRAASERSFPPGTIAPNESDHPEFVQIDFAVVEDDSGAHDIRLIELQGFPSLYGFQEALGYMSINHYGLNGVRHLSNGLTRDSYYELLRRVVYRDHDQENVVLLEVDPLHQKTRPDFLVTEKMIGVPTVDITTVEREGRELLYRRDGKRIPIRRIYNRAIIDELERKQTPMSFSFADDIDVEWACHPNWFYRISKFSIPYLRHPTVPRTTFLHELDGIPDNLEDYVLKPLYSFAGSGVIVSPTREDLDLIQEEYRSVYLLQEKIEYAPVLQTPSGGTKVELRVMILWDKEPIPTQLLVRTGRGKMMGVDFNKNLDWVGATCCLVEE